MSLAGNLTLALAYHGLIFLTLLALIVVVLRGYGRHEERMLARAAARIRCGLCGEAGCDGTRERCVGRWR